MNASTTTVSGKTKLKIVLLGNANVGKTCIIDQYVHNRFEESSNVIIQTFSQLSVLIFWLKT